VRGIVNSGVDDTYTTGLSIEAARRGITASWEGSEHFLWRTEYRRKNFGNLQTRGDGEFRIQAGFISSRSPERRLQGSVRARTEFRFQRYKRVRSARRLTHQSQSILRLISSGWTAGPVIVYDRRRHNIAAGARCGNERGQGLRRLPHRATLTHAHARREAVCHIPPRPAPTHPPQPQVGTSHKGECQTSHIKVALELYSAVQRSHHPRAHTAPTGEPLPAWRSGRGATCHTKFRRAMSKASRRRHCHPHWIE